MEFDVATNLGLQGAFWTGCRSTRCGNFDIILAHLARGCQPLRHPTRAVEDAPLVPVPVSEAVGDTVGDAVVGEVLAI